MSQQARRLVRNMVTDDEEELTREDFTPSNPCTSTGLIKVRYGENKQTVFNSHCQCNILIQFMKKKCGYPNADMLDLISWRFGDLQNLPENGSDYASNYLKEREVYVLVNVIEDDTQPNPQYISLLNDLSKQKPDLALKLHDLSKPQARVIRAKWTTLSKKGLEASGITPHTHTVSRKGALNTIIESNKTAVSSSKLVGALAAALKKHRADRRLETMEEPRTHSGRRSSGRRGSRRLSVEPGL